MGIAKAIYSGIQTGIAFWKGDTESTQHFASEMGSGIGLAAGVWGGAKFGAMISAWTANPVIIAAATGIGMLIGGLAGTKLGSILGDKLGEQLNKISDWFFGTETFQKMHVSLKDVEKATEAVQSATNDYFTKLSELDELEKLYGEDAKSVYDQVEEGTLKVQDMTTEQYKLYTAYQDMLKAKDLMIEKQKQELEVDAKWEEEQAKKSDDYTQYIKTLEDGAKRGIISQEDMTKHFAMTYANLDAEHKRIFLLQLPKEVRDSVEEQSAQYVTKWTKFKQTAEQLWDRFKTSMSIVWEAIKTTMLTVMTGGLYGLYKAFPETFEKILTAVGTWITNFVTAVGKLFDSIFKMATETWQRVCNFFKGKGFKTNEQVSGSSRNVSIATYAVGTNYVPSDGLAYLHQGEAVIPKKYNTPYQSDNSGMISAIDRLAQQVEVISEKVDKGIPVTGQFVQKGSDLVATVNKVNNRISNNILSNKVYAR